MSTSITISASALMLAPPALLLAGGLIVGIALRGYLTTGIEVARLNAANDDKTARWLWLRGYRSTPHAGPDLTPELTADDAVTGEVLAVNGVDTEADAQHEDDHHSDGPAWQVWLAAAAAVLLVALLLPVWLTILAVDWVRGLVARRREQRAQRAAEIAYDDEFWDRLNKTAGELTREPAPVPETVRIVRRDRFRPAGETGQFPYVKVAGAPRHAAPEPEMPAINPVPAQRTGDADADR